ncbi:MAG: hypothetical protein GX416_08785 [Bacteroidales bacterium]|nr:hypothetical protein [Bacteroidales bacterium]
MMKNILYCFLCALLIFGCSGSNSVDTPVDPDPNEAVVFKLSAEQVKVNIFDPVKLSIVDNRGLSPLLYSQILKATCDSMVWDVKDLNERMLVFAQKKDASHEETVLKFTWIQCFYLPAVYETYLLGYRGGKIISRDTLRIDVTNERDFLYRSWGDLDNMGYNIGHNNSLNKNQEFCTFASKEDDTPTLDLRLFNVVNEEESSFSRKSENELYRFISQLYGQPQYTHESSELIAKYNELFAVHPEAYTPIACWLTKKAKIVLLKRNASEENIPECHIHAEPLSK